MSEKEAALTARVDKLEESVLVLRGLVSPTHMVELHCDGSVPTPELEIECSGAEDAQEVKRRILETVKEVGGVRVTVVPVEREAA